MSNRPSTPSPPRRARRTEKSHSPSPSPPRRRRTNSSSDDEPPRRPKYQEGSVTSELTSKQKSVVTSTGHRAGLQRASEFKERERKLKHERDEEAAALAAQSQQEETVYRDKRGRKLDALTEFMRQTAADEGKKARIEEAQYEWGRGSVQKAEAEATKKELEEIANEPFARLESDPKLERERREIIRDGDPMAEYMMKKQQERQQILGNTSNSRSGGQQKPVYKGPWIPPNRFHILPGYRWDGIDRGNGFEKTLLKKINERASAREDEYKWSVSDM